MRLTELHADLQTQRENLAAELQSINRYEAQRAADPFDRVRYIEVRRTENTDADRQVNLALDRA